MKKLMLVLMVLLLIVVSASADIARWDASECADGYKIYYNEYSTIIGESTECDLDALNLVPGVEYTFQVTAYNGYGESVKSNSLTYTKGSYTPTENIPPMVICFPGPVTIQVNNGSN